jgi:plastocyanin
MTTKILSRNFIQAVAMTTLFAIASASGISAAQAQQANAVVIKNFDFAPMSLTIKAGTSVTWKNLDGEPHTVTSVDGLFRSGAIDQDGSFTFKFDKPGTYMYLCSIHPKMRASIIVQ